MIANSIDTSFQLAPFFRREMEFRKAIRGLPPFTVFENTPHGKLKESFRPLLQNHKLIIGANILYPGSGEIKNFFRSNQKVTPNREALLLASALTKGIFKIRRSPFPGELIDELLPGSTSELARTLIATNSSFFIKIDGRVSQLVTALANLASKLGAWVENVKFVQNPLELKTTQTQIVRYHAWNHKFEHEILSEIVNFESSLLTLSSALGWLPVVFAFDDMAFQLELADALTVGFSLFHKPSSSSSARAIYQSRAPRSFFHCQGYSFAPQEAHADGPESTSNSPFASL